MHLMAAERRCFEDLTATLHDGPAMKEGGGGVDAERWILIRIRLIHTRRAPRDDENHGHVRVDTKVYPSRAALVSSMFD